jgi:hypothetical protein
MNDYVTSSPYLYHNKLHPLVILHRFSALNDTCHEQQKPFAAQKLVQKTTHKMIQCSIQTKCRNGVNLGHEKLQCGTQ